MQKVVWLLEELRAAVPAGRITGGNSTTPRPRNTCSLNPNGKVPTLVDGEAVVWESNTILRYLCNKLAAGAALYPRDPAARSQVERWMDWQLASLNAPYLGVFREAKKKEEERAASFAADAKELSAQLEILEKGTAGRPWIAGANLFHRRYLPGTGHRSRLAFPVSLPALPGVRAWRDRIVAREAYKKSKG